MARVGSSGLNDAMFGDTCYCFMSNAILEHLTGMSTFREECIIKLHVRCFFLSSADCPFQELLKRVILFFFS